VPLSAADGDVPAAVTTEFAALFDQAVAELWQLVVQHGLGSQVAARSLFVLERVCPRLAEVQELQTAAMVALWLVCKLDVVQLQDLDCGLDEQVVRPLSAPPELC
jgi:hypothetical protein